MIDDLKPYSVYKDSGVPWLGHIPQHWGVRRMKLLLREIDGRSMQGNEQLLRVSQYTGVTERRNSGDAESPDTRAASLVGYKLVERDDLVINIMLAWNGSLGVSRYTGIVSPAYCVYRFNSISHPWYFHELLRLPVYKGRIKIASTGVVESRLRLYSDELGRIEALEPPFGEQEAIVRYVNYINGNVNRFIRAKKKQIALLNEQKQAIIHRAVTRGLDPNVKLKPSGIEWLGDVPIHWDVTRLGRVTHLTTGFPFKSAGFSEGQNDTRLLRGINIAPGNIRWEQTVRWPANDRDRFALYELHEGDIVIGMDRPIIRTGVRVAKLGPSDVPALLLQRVARICADGRINRDFLFLLLAGKSFCDYLAPIFTGISVPHISPDQIKSFRVVLPSVEEQEAIVRKIEVMTKTISRSIDVADREIDLLREYRTRLIADIVTGRLDVREAAAKLPDLALEPEPLDEVEDILQDDSMTEDETDEVSKAA